MKSQSFIIEIKIHVIVWTIVTQDDCETSAITKLTVTKVDYVYILFILVQLHMIHIEVINLFL